MTDSRTSQSSGQSERLAADLAEGFGRRDGGEGSGAIGAQSVLADDQVQRLPRRRAALGDLAGDLPLEALRVEATLAADHGIGRGQTLVEGDRVEDEGRARAEASAVGPKPTGKS